MAKNIEEMTENVANDQSNDEQSETPNISVNDLVLMVRVIDAATQRGAIRGEELTTVGSLRDKIYNLVKTVSPESVSEESDEDSSESESNE